VRCSLDDLLEDVGEGRALRREARHVAAGDRRPQHGLSRVVVGRVEDGVPAVEVEDRDAGLVAAPAQ